MKRTDIKRYLHEGDCGIFVCFDDCADDDAVMMARQLGRILRDSQSVDGLVDVTPGLKNLLIHYDPLKTSFKKITAIVNEILPDLKINHDQPSRQWKLPVLYGGEAGPDLDEVAALTGCSADEVINKHLGAVLTVAIMGFLPGLAYMKGVDAALYLPRRSSPRQHVKARSVGIAMDQTVIYPLPSPGGWNLIGRTPVRPFDASRDDPVLFNPGDQVRFVAIDQAEYDRLDDAATQGVTIIKPEER